jgi:archaellum component FlaC
VNFNSLEFLKDLEKTKDKLDDSVSLDQIQGALNLPELSEFSKLAEGLLPENLIKVDENGKLGLPSLTELQGALFSGLSDIKDYLDKEISAAFNSIKGEIQNVMDEAKDVYDDLSNLSETISNASSTVSDMAIDALNNATGLNVNVQDLGNIQKTITNSIESFTQLSPKKVKDLADPEFYGRVVNATLNTTLDLAGNAAQLAAMNGLIQDQVDSSGYVDMFKSAIERGKNVLPKEKESDDTEYKIVVKRTVYWGKGEGATPESAAKKANSGNKLMDDYSLLVDNSKVLIGSKVKFFDDQKEREAVDVATPSKGISISGEYPTIAIYFDTKEKAQAYMKARPDENVVAFVTVPSPKEKEKKQKLKKDAKEIKTEISKEEAMQKLKEPEKREAELVARGVAI